MSYETCNVCGHAEHYGKCHERVPAFGDYNDTQIGGTVECDCNASSDGSE